MKRPAETLGLPWCGLGFRAAVHGSSGADIFVYRSNLAQWYAWGKRGLASIRDPICDALLLLASKRSVQPDHAEQRSGLLLPGLQRSLPANFGGVLIFVDGEGSPADSLQEARDTGKPLSSLTPRVACL